MIMIALSVIALTLTFVLGRKYYIDYVVPLEKQRQLESGQIEPHELYPVLLEWELDDHIFIEGVRHLYKGISREGKVLLYTGGDIISFDICGLMSDPFIYNEGLEIRKMIKEKKETLKSADEYMSDLQIEQDVRKELGLID